MANKMTAQDLVDNLRAAGFDGALIEEYLCCWKDGETGRQLELLSAKRANFWSMFTRRKRKSNVWTIWCI